MSLAWVLLAACESGETDAARLARALDATTPTEAALLACRSMSDPVRSAECVATVVRARPDTPESACARIPSAGTRDPDRDAVSNDAGVDRWRGECWFTVAERLAATGDRWGALAACGRAGAFYDECLFHAWTAELTEAARTAPDAFAALPQGRDSIQFWSGIETVGTDPAALLWNDFWFFAHNAHRPADLGACDGLTVPGEAETCREGTRVFVLRALLGALLAPGTDKSLPDRICRSGEVPGTLTEGLYRPHPDLDAQVATAAALSCDVAAGKPVRRWNPVFSGRRRRD